MKIGPTIPNQRNTCIGFRLRIFFLMPRFKKAKKMHQTHTVQVQYVQEVLNHFIMLL